MQAIAVGSRKAHASLAVMSRVARPRRLETVNDNRRALDYLRTEGLTENGGLMEAIKLTVEERLDIAELAVRYGNIVDDRDWSRFSELFTEDAVLTISGLPDGEVV